MRTNVRPSDRKEGFAMKNFLRRILKAGGNGNKFIAIALAQPIRNHKHLYLILTDGEGHGLTVAHAAQLTAIHTVDLGVTAHGIFHVDLHLHHAADKALVSGNR